MIFYNENIMVGNKKSPYTTITGCTFLFYEFQRILPLLMDANSESLLKDEIESNYSAPPMGMSNRLTVVLQQELH